MDIVLAANAIFNEGTTYCSSATAEAWNSID
jgi:hypothetical protein